MLLLTGSAALAAHACSLGSGVLEDDQRQAFGASEEVFVARLSNYRDLPPLPGRSEYLAASDYVLVEAIKGHPEPHGTLVSSNPYKTIPGQPPGPACGPWLLYPDANGRTALIFANRDGNADRTLRWVNPFSRFMAPDDPDSRQMLDRIRKLTTTDPLP